MPGGHVATSQASSFHVLLVLRARAYTLLCFSYDHSRPCSVWVCNSRRLCLMWWLKNEEEKKVRWVERDSVRKFTTGSSVFRVCLLSLCFSSPILWKKFLLTGMGNYIDGTCIETLLCPDSDAVERTVKQPSHCLSSNKENSYLFTKHLNGFLCSVLPLLWRG